MSGAPRKLQIAQPDQKIGWGKRGRYRERERREVTRISGLPLTSVVVLNKLVGISEPQISHHKVRIIPPPNADPSAQLCCED